MLNNPNFISKWKYGCNFHLIVYSVIPIKYISSSLYEKESYARTTPVTV